MGRAIEALGTSKPFGTLGVDWLWQRKADLPGMLVVTPTAQSGRLLRQGLAEKGGVLAPRVVTAGHFISPEGAASESVEILAWAEVLEGISDWSEYAEAFPQAPDQGDGPGWVMDLAKSLTGLRFSLIEGSFTLHSAARRLAESVEGPRWQALALLEERVEKVLASWGYESRSSLVSQQCFEWSDDVKEVLLVGMLDVSPAVTKVLEKAPVPVRIIVAEGEGLDDWGRPNESWAEREEPWPEVTLSGDSRQQAEAALQKVAEGGFRSDDVTLGSADEEVAAELVRSFGRAGWSLYNPGSQRSPLIVPWLAAWRRYLQRATAAEVMDLLSFPQTGPLVGFTRHRRAGALSRLRDSHLIRNSDDVTRVRSLLEKELLAAEGSDRAKHVERAVQEAILTEETMARLEDARDRFLRRGFHEGMEELLESIDPKRDSGAREWLATTAGLKDQIQRPISFWLELMQAALPVVVDPPPEERVLDVLGWLELFFETGSHLVICGVNEGLVPTRASTDSWLPEATRRVLQLSTDRSRHARDAYLLTCMMRSRASSGRVDLLLGKSSGSGDVLQPSRLLLAAKGEELARRVEKLFREVSPPEDGLSWDLTERWKWLVNREERPEKMNVTGFSDYLACPFRFYLKHVKKMQRAEPERIEWNARDFGNLMHEVLERFGQNHEARYLQKSSEIESWVQDSLREVLRERFGDQPPAAVRIQQEVMMRRLSWFAEKQAAEMEEGWRITEVERSFELPVAGLVVRGQIDRIERQEGSGRCRVIDYKTSSQAKNVANAHGVAVRADEVWPEHLKEVDAVKAFLPVGRAGKVVEARWINLQVALYAAAHGEVPEVGYFALGASAGNVGLSMWPDFGEAEIESALACAEWIVRRIQEAEDPFWPPVEKVKYDDYESLRFGKLLEEVVR